MPEEETTARDREGNEFVLRSIECPICHCTDERVLGLRGGRHHRYGQGLESRIVQCVRCSLIYPNPFPFPVNPSELYGDPDKYFENHDLEVKLESSKAVVRRLLDAMPSGRADSLLDVGCGRGEFLMAAKQEGVEDLVGLEFSPAMAEYAEREFGLSVELQSIEDYAARAGRTFDILTLNAVLEHVYEPSSMLEAASRLTAKGSILYLDLPNEPSLMVRAANAYSALRGRETVYSLSPTWPPYHVFGFNPESIQRICEKHGFRIEKLEVRSNPRVLARGGAKDRLKAFVATQINHVANRTGMASNMFIRARRVD